MESNRLSQLLVCFFEFPYFPKEHLRKFVTDRLILSYDIPIREYHNTTHIEHCLKELDSYHVDNKIGAVVEVALWYHDAIYDSRWKDNEERSAFLAGQDLVFLGVPDEYILDVQRLIMATKHAVYPNDKEDERVIVDIDLSILGQPYEVYKEYAKQIRAEYAHVDDEGYKSGRIKFLKTLLARPQIYQTDFFRTRYEDTARSNMTQEIEQLS